MFYTPKPRQFHYQPRFYDPEKERWEALKQKYADERALREALEEAESGERKVESGEREAESGKQDADLEYFQRRVRELDREEKHRGLTWKDMFRKREMPKFRYQPRFQSTESTESAAEGGEQGVGEHLAEFKKRGVKIKRRFDVTGSDDLEPVPAGRIMLYALLVCMLLYWILF